MNTSSVYSKYLRKFIIDSPVIFTFHLNWKVFENIGLEQFKHIKQGFLSRGVKNIELLPILTDKKSDLESRIKQFKRGTERIADKYGKKAHVVAYSFSGIVTKSYIGLDNGEEYIESLLTIGTPHNGCRFADSLVSRLLIDKMYLIEPALRSTGVHLDWFKEEYPSKILQDNSKRFNYGEVKFHSVGGRRIPIKTSETLRFTSEDLSDDSLQSHPNDGLVCVEECEFGKHLLNFDADHFELIGMRPGFNANQLFDLYVQTVKSCDQDFNNSISKGEILKEGSEQVLREMTLDENSKQTHNYI
jgi:hypothetical protein